MCCIVYAMLVHRMNLNAYVFFFFQALRNMWHHLQVNFVKFFRRKSATHMLQMAKRKVCALTKFAMQEHA